ncbi:MAG: hypothetical protein WCW44_05570 [archaeon]|jgi:hypothetical protein
MPQARNPKTLQFVDLSELKLETKLKEKEVTNNQKEIRKSINAIGKPVELPKKSEKRFEDLFGKKKEKTAIKIVITAFVILFLFLLFLQPSLYFYNTNDNTILANLSDRELTNVKVYSANTLFDLFSLTSKPPILQKANMLRKEEIKMDFRTTTVLIAFADRQLPAIGTIITQEDFNQNTTINNTNTDSNAGIYRGLQGQIPTSD